MLSARWSKSVNIVLQVLEEFNPATFAKYAHVIQQRLCIPARVQHAENIAQGGIVFNAILRDLDGNVRDAGDIVEEVMALNPIFNGIELNRPPMWLLRREVLENLPTHQTVAKIYLSFQDPDGDVVQVLTKTSISVCGQFVFPEAFRNKMILIQCTKCWGFEHTANSCQRAVRCRMCGDNHPSSEHKKKCRQAGCEGTNNGICTHPKRCINCTGEHVANSGNCPARLRYNQVTPVLDREQWARKEASKAARSARKPNTPALVVRPNSPMREDVNLGGGTSS